MYSENPLLFVSFVYLLFAFTYIHIFETLANAVYVGGLSIFLFHSGQCFGVMLPIPLRLATTRKYRCLVWCLVVIHVVVFVGLCIGNIH